MNDFVHLHVHSHYSLLDGLPKIDELLDYAEALDMEAVALTDHGNLYGAIEFYQKAQQRDIKPILGCEVYLARDKRTQKRKNIDNKNYHLTLLAKNKTGYQNLVKIVTKAHLEGFYYKPRIDKELLREYHEGLIALSGCLEGEIPQAIISGKNKQAQRLAQEYQDIFGKDNFYLEIQHHPHLEHQGTVNQTLADISEQTGISLVATNDVHYLKPEDNEAQDILQMINMKKTVDDDNRISMMEHDFSMRSPQQMKKDFSDFPEAVKNTVKIAKKCNLKLELGKTKLPHFETPGGKTADEYLRKLCKKGIKKRFHRKTKEIKERLDYELEVIEKMGFASYFLIVRDFVTWAKDHHIVVGPGRGSAAGSLVSYLLNITDVDPLKYDLLFERFLNPERVSMPDIDLDFADRRRDEVIEYIADKYGRGNVAQIITFGTMAARGSIRDVGRVLNYSYDFCDKLAKMVPMNMKLEQALNNIAELRKEYHTDQKVKKLIDLAKKIEGTVRHASTHACGVVVSNQPLTNIVPLQHPPQEKDKIITQYEMHSVEALGLLKIDLLGLKNLTLIEDTLSRIYAIHKKNIDIDQIPLDDKKIYELLQQGNTTGVFQLESSGIKGYLKQLRPTTFEDIIAMVALYRPGPMKFIPKYIACKHGEEEVSYLHPQLEPILKDTYGIAIYQEQIIQIAHQLAGFSLSEADILRKAIGKKIKKLLDSQKKKFIQGMTDNDIGEDIAKELWHWIEPFARYSFNKSHATSYAKIAYQTAYLKAHYPVEFMSALLSLHSDDLDKTSFFIRECKNMNIGVLAPDINESFRYFSVVPKKDQIRFGLSAIKNVGDKVVERIIDERKENGDFQSFNNFINRVKDLRLNRRTLESLAKAGAFDNLVERNKIIYNLDKITRQLRKLRQETPTQRQDSLFKQEEVKPKIKLTNTEKEIPQDKKLKWEKKLLGLYVSAHPLHKHQEKLEQEVCAISEVDETYTGQRIKIGGIIQETKKAVTKNNHSMLFAKVKDLNDKIDVVVFPDALSRYGNFFREGEIVFITGKVDTRRGRLNLICEKAEKINSE